MDNNNNLPLSLLEDEILNNNKLKLPAISDDCTDSPVKPKIGKPKDLVWALLTKAIGAYQVVNGPYSLCHHCNVKVAHHNKTVCVKRHLLKCSEFLKKMKVLPEQNRPNWFLAHNLGPLSLKSSL